MNPDKRQRVGASRLTYRCTTFRKRKPTVIIKMQMGINLAAARPNLIRAKLVAEHRNLLATVAEADPSNTILRVPLRLRCSLEDKEPTEFLAGDIDHRPTALVWLLCHVKNSVQDALGRKPRAIIFTCLPVAERPRASSRRC